MTKPSLREKAKKASRLRSRTLVCVIENPKLLHNLMSIVRTSEALGVGKVYVIDKNNILKGDWEKMREDKQMLNLSSSGIKWLFVKKFSSTSECVEHLAKKRFTNVGTSPHQLGKCNVLLSEGKYTQPHLAVWFGNESHGLSKEALDACNFCIQIPMYGIIESMNLASSASVVLNHIVEERQKYSRNKLKNK
jgi:tRNA (guanosine-2'-O-)-methyltransferase